MLPIVPLHGNTVLLPGATLRIPITNRPDIPALLAQVYSKAAIPRTDPSSVSIGCVPLRSPNLSSNGQKFIDDRNTSEDFEQTPAVVEPGRVTKENLFDFGTLAKITGVQGRPSGELDLIVEGINRFSLRAVARETPCIEAEVIYHHDEGVCR